MKKNLMTLFGAALALTLPLAAGAQTYPDRPVRVLHGFAAGGNADVVARLVGAEMAKGLGQPIVVEPKAGAGGTIAAATVASAKPDGYNLLLATGGHAIAGVLYDKLPYDTAKSFQPISALTSFPFLVVVNAASPHHSLGDLIKAAKARPNPMTFGSAGIGTGQHMTGELLANRAGSAFTHVPYRGESASVTALLGNEVDFVVIAPTTALPQVKAGKLRALGTSGSARWSGLPDVPTVAEQGVPNFEVRSWTALLAPAGTPQPVIDRLNAQVATALQDATLRSKLAEATGGDVHASTPRDLQATIEGDLKRWGQLVKDAKIQKD
ncbi:tripartite tricarboxylate transporter substrate binding protein [Hydrogenophaga flava]|uniref:tripartite tricarboxylate transporter substrate binding protein n=1 Tax=Hydrogenophaga flava TaxID=65657 RepID=UPI000ABD3426|nr:tripartite tricarboxylate transporter substrate binding protein [Hydrogenophaga flava]